MTANGASDEPPRETLPSNEQPKPIVENEGDHETDHGFQLSATGIILISAFVVAAVAITWALYQLYQVYAKQKALDLEDGCEEPGSTFCGFLGKRAKETTLGNIFCSMTFTDKLICTTEFIDIGTDYLFWSSVRSSDDPKLIKYSRWILVVICGSLLLQAVKWLLIRRDVKEGRYSGEDSKYRLAYMGFLMAFLEDLPQAILNILTMRELGSTKISELSLCANGVCILFKLLKPLLLHLRLLDNELFKKMKTEMPPMKSSSPTSMDLEPSLHLEVCTQAANMITSSSPIETSMDREPSLHLEVCTKPAGSTLPDSYRQPELECSPTSCEDLCAVQMGLEPTLSSSGIEDQEVRRRGSNLEVRRRGSNLEVRPRGSPAATATVVCPDLDQCVETYEVVKSYEAGKTLGFEYRLKDGLILEVDNCQDEVQAGWRIVKVGGEEFSDCALRAAVFNVPSTFTITYEVCYNPDLSEKEFSDCAEKGEDPGCVSAPELCIERSEGAELCIERSEGGLPELPSTKPQLRGTSGSSSSGLSRSFMTTRGKAKSFMHTPRANDDDGLQLYSLGSCSSSFAGRSGPIISVRSCSTSSLAGRSGPIIPVRNAQDSSDQPSIKHCANGQGLFTKSMLTELEPSIRRDCAYDEGLFTGEMLTELACSPSIGSPVTEGVTTEGVTGPFMRETFAHAAE